MSDWLEIPSQSTMWNKVLIKNQSNISSQSRADTGRVNIRTEDQQPAKISIMYSKLITSAATIILLLCLVETGNVLSSCNNELLIRWRGLPRHPISSHPRTCQLPEPFSKNSSVFLGEKYFWNITTIFSKMTWEVILAPVQAMHVPAANLAIKNMFSG